LIIVSFVIHIIKHMKKFLENKYVKFGIVGTLYLLWVIWLGNFWFLIGLAVVFDIYVTGKVNWAFWKKRNGPNSAVVEWLDAIIFAVIAVTLINIFLFQNYRIPTPSMEKTLLVGDHLFVSKVAFGPRMPNTPIAMPFTQNTLPFTGGKGKSWSDLIQRPYKRIAGFGKVKNNDVVVFNFPAGDTVWLPETETSYYEILRRNARDLMSADVRSGKAVKSWDEYMKESRKWTWNKGKVIYRPVDRRDNYVKRCVGIPGDKIFIKDGQLYVNDKLVPERKTQQSSYNVFTNGAPINQTAFDRLDISHGERNDIYGNGSVYNIAMNKATSEKFSGFINVTGVREILLEEGDYDPAIFPHSESYPWNVDNFGPLFIPAKGETVKLDTINICFYNQIINIYEENTLEVKDGVIYINGKPSDSYTFKMDYYWMMGDNRHRSADSRYWGFVPEDHIVGKPKLIWLSVNKEATGIKKIRFNRMFMRIK